MLLIFLLFLNGETAAEYFPNDLSVVAQWHEESLITFDTSELDCLTFN